MYHVAGTFHREKFRYLLSLVKVFIYEIFFSRVNDCIEDMVTFIILAIINSVKCFCNT